MLTIIRSRMREEDQRRIDESRRNGIDERWRRRAFYTDEEDGATTPEGYQRDPAFDGISGNDAEDEALDPSPVIESHPPSPRSRSSSKVRFQDDIADDYDVRSNPSTSSRSIPVGERWGGYEIPEAEKDIGKEILYQVTQQGFNELLDLLFKEKEDLLMEVYRTRADRKIWAYEIELVEKSGPPRPPSDSPKEKPHPRDEDDLQAMTNERSLEELLQRTGYGLRDPTLDPTSSGPLQTPPTGAMSGDDEARLTHLANTIDGNEIGQNRYVDIGSETASTISLSYPNDQAPVSEAVPAQGFSDEEEPERNMDEPFAYDPTLPQFRPDSESPIPHLAFRDEPALVADNFSQDESPESASDLPNHHLLQPNVTTSFHAPSSSRNLPTVAETNHPETPPSPMQPLPPPHRFTNVPESTPEPPRPSFRTLARWAYLNKVEREAQARGGSGAKLNFEEFAQRMAADKGRRLAFVASWIEMASF